METAVLPVSAEGSKTLRKLTSGGQPGVLTDPAGAAVAVVPDVDSYEEARELVATVTLVFLVDPSGHQVGVVLDAASYQQAEAVALAASLPSARAHPGPPA